MMIRLPPSESVPAFAASATEALPPGEGEHTPMSAAIGVEQAFGCGRPLETPDASSLGGKLPRFSELERAIPTISQKMLIQQLRQMETDGHAADRPSVNSS